MRRIFLIIFLLAGLLASVISGLWLLACILFSPYGQRATRISIAYDQLANAATGGSEDETISSRAGRMLLRGDKGWPCVLCRILNWLESDHCKKSIGI